MHKGVFRGEPGVYDPQWPYTHRWETFGATENTRRENDGPSKSQGVKMQDMKMQDLKRLDTIIDGMKQFLTCSEVTEC